MTSRETIRVDRLGRRELIQRLELALEDLECVHLWLDDQGASSVDVGGELSIVGRVMRLMQTYKQKKEPK